MANILRSVSSKIGYFNVNRILLISTRNCGWNRDWKPGQYPKTAEERAAAAKKYNLIPEDYEPYPEGDYTAVAQGEAGRGDYPKLPVVGQDARDPYEDYDWHYRRRNFGETLHINYDIYTSDHHNPNEVTRYSPLVMWSSMLAFCSIFFIFGFLDDYFNLRVVYPLKPKQYPHPGVVHYTFEPLD